MRFANGRRKEIRVLAHGLVIRTIMENRIRNVPNGFRHRMRADTKENFVHITVCRKKLHCSRKRKVGRWVVLGSETKGLAGYRFWVVECFHMLENSFFHILFQGKHARERLNNDVVDCFHNSAVAAIMNLAQYKTVGWNCKRGKCVTVQLSSSLRCRHNP